MTKNSFKALLLLAFTTWVSHFFYFEKFGLYEDDYANIPSHFGKSLDYIIDHVEHHSVYWLQGHPLAFLPGVFTFIGDQLADGFQILYVIAFIIITVNSFLMYKVLKQVFPQSELFAVIGALIFCLFPPDTAKTFLLSTYMLQMSLMFLLIAALLYLKGWKTISYFVIILSIFTYESVFIIFFAIPLLKDKFDKKFKWELLRHVLILCTIIVLIFLYRKSTGEYRVVTETKNMMGLINKIIPSLFIGPAVVFFLFFRAPVVAIKDWLDLPISNWYESIAIFIGFCFIVFMWYLYKLKPENRVFVQNDNSVGVTNDAISEDSDTSKYFWKVGKILIAGVVMICLAYAVSFTHYPPTALIGRLTSVHLAATFGGSIIFACICSSIIFIANKYRFRTLAIAILAAYLSLLVAYQIRIQRDFADSWEDQKKFWVQVVELCSDMKENTMIFVLNGENNRWLRFTNYIYSYTWADNLVLKYLFKFPLEWKNPPKIQVVHNAFRSQITLTNGELMWIFPPYETSGYEVLPDSNVIILQLDQNLKLSRLDSNFVTLKGKKVYLKPKEPPVLPSLEKGVLYEYILEKNP